MFLAASDMTVADYTAVIQQGGAMILLCSAAVSSLNYRPVSVLIFEQFLQFICIFIQWSIFRLLRAEELQNGIKDEANSAEVVSLPLAAPLNSRRSLATIDEEKTVAFDITSSGEASYTRPPSYHWHQDAASSFLTKLASTDSKIDPLGDERDAEQFIVADAKDIATPVERSDTHS